MFKTDYTFYYKTMTWIAAIFCCSLYFTLKCESYWAHFTGAVLLGCFWQQLAFVGHDLGHNGITHIQMVDNILGVMVGNFFGGISIGWWKRSHNVHHIVCNSIDHDPDIQHLPAMAVTKNIFPGFFSTYHMKEFVFDSLSRFLVAYQHWLYYPIMGLARFNLYVQSLLLLFNRKETVAYRPLEFLGMLCFLAWMTCLTCSLPSGERLMFVLVSHIIGGVLHV